MTPLTVRNHGSDTCATKYVALALHIRQPAEPAFPHQLVCHGIGMAAMAQEYPSRQMADRRGGSARRAAARREQPRSGGALI
jgi:hypothetical protein